MTKKSTLWHKYIKSHDAIELKDLIKLFYNYLFKESKDIDNA